MTTGEFAVQIPNAEKEAKQKGRKLCHFRPLKIAYDFRQSD